MPCAAITPLPLHARLLPLSRRHYDAALIDAAADADTAAIRYDFDYAMMLRCYAIIYAPPPLDIDAAATPDAITLLPLRCHAAESAAIIRRHRHYYDAYAFTDARCRQFAAACRASC